MLISARLQKFAVTSGCSNPVIFVTFDIFNINGSLRTGYMRTIQPRVLFKYINQLCFLFLSCQRFKHIPQLPTLSPAASLCRSVSCRAHNPEVCFCKIPPPGFISWIVPIHITWSQTFPYASSELIASCPPGKCNVSFQPGTLNKFHASSLSRSLFLSYYPISVPLALQSGSYYTSYTLHTFICVTITVNANRYSVLSE